MVSGTKFPSSSGIWSLCSFSLALAGQTAVLKNVSSDPPFPPPCPPSCVLCLSDSERWWASETGKWLPSVTGMMEFWRVCVGSRNAASKPCTHNLLKNIPWAENVFFLFSPPLLLCQAGTMAPLRGAAARGCWQGGWK